MGYQQIFSYHAPTKMTFGPGAIQELVAELKRLNVGKPLIVTDKGIKGAGILDKVTTVLNGNRIPFSVFDGVEENPSTDVVVKGAGIYREEKCNGFIAIGGGSPTDSSKAIGIVITNPGDITQYEGAGKVGKPIPPVIAIPTTYGTGSETTYVSVITDKKRTFKFVISSPHIFCAAAILDPNLVVTLPRKIGASTGMDALTHSIETHVSLISQQMSSALALHAIKMIGENLRQAVANDYNLAATENMMIASAIAGMAFTNSRLGTVHAMAHPLSAHFGIHHGMSCGLLLPHVMEFNLGACPEKFGEIARAMGEITNGLSTMDAAYRAVEAVRKLMRDVDMPFTLRELGVREEKIPQLVEDSMLSGAIPINPRKTTKEDVERLFRKAF
jgi:alcohol dehydrogenase class IV